MERVRFWALESSTTTSNFGTAGWLNVDGVMVDNSGFDPHASDGKDVWVEYDVPVGTTVNKLEIYVRDITKNASIFIDDIEIVCP